MKWHQIAGKALMNVAALTIVIPAYAILALVFILAWTWPLIAILLIAI